MTADSTFPLDSTDWRILAELQQDGRLSYSELGRRVGLGATAATDRVRRLVEAGVIRAFRAEVDLERVGYGVQAVVRLRYPSGNYRRLHTELERTPEILQCHHVTGEDCFVMTVATRNMRHLEEVAGRIAALGSITTSVVYSSPLPSRVVSEPRSV
ncbi:Lrp/AsnC family transcriptional regulator [Streptoalloteichus hindustanus]|uniref:Lrp/AsnC family transcriptional regulator, leucine-responsive regulatory protein n=1 Tax=Streptoalloteichus hindustanus TaxID=2017 RepID=A0A1M5J409_STRHI|nr:Lrp/AsnC family transcriptional regulator [Streptoalloteichus hindustanus]SHG35272.1 Lrp/AsnC family transcriptional regulator, leucine-responsive regulatory protein [Streptoalloteichus hindustanus]